MHITRHTTSQEDRIVELEIELTVFADREANGGTRDLLFFEASSQFRRRRGCRGQRRRRGAYHGWTADGRGRTAAATATWCVVYVVRT
jgi:hypothetical protein